MSRSRATLVVFLLLNILNFTSRAQSSSSPYSRYGIGDLNNKTYGQGTALGGTTIALQNDTTAMFFINTSNPASYSNVRLTTAELGLNYNRITLMSATDKKVVNNAGFGYVSIAFPLKKWCGASFGMIPLSSVGYNVTDQKEIDNIGTVNYQYEGSGGVSQVYLGLGFKPLYGLPKAFLNSNRRARLKQENNLYKIYKIMKRKKALQQLSFGGNVSYLFGNIENTRTSTFSAPSTFNTRTGTTTRIGDVYMDYGMQYAFTIDSIRGRDLRDNVKLIFGATFAAESEVRAKIDSLSYNFYTSSTGYEIIKDTVEYIEGHKGTVTLPLSFGFGLALKKGDKFMIAADFAMQNWSSYQAFNSNTGLKNSMRASLGMQFVPNSKTNGFNNYHKRIHYRIGAKYMQTALELKNSQLLEYGASIGFGFPVGRNFLLQNFSMVNIGVEVGERGTTNNGLIKEQYFKASIGFTINDRWFVKPKYD